MQVVLGTHTHAPLFVPFYLINLTMSLGHAFLLEVDTTYERTYITLLRYVRDCKNLK